MCVWDFAECVPDWRICGSLDIIAQILERAVQFADVRVRVLLRGELKLRHIAHTLPPVIVHCHRLGLSACGWQQFSEVSALVYFAYTVAMESTFANVCQRAQASQCQHCLSAAP